MDRYSAIALEDIAMFVENDGIRNNETYEELTKAKKLKELQTKLTKARKSNGKGEYN
jgi:hypothetical protein